MTTEEIHKLLVPLRRNINFTPPRSDYQRLRDEETRSFSMAFSFFFLGYIVLFPRNTTPGWPIVLYLIALMILAGFMVMRGYKYRKACAVFERYVPASLDELDEKIMAPQAAPAASPPSPR